MTIPTGAPEVPLPQNPHRLVISFDIGTTQSAVTFAYLPGIPGLPPLVESVDSWPGQESSMYESRVPTAVLYDRGGRLVACGAEAVARESEFATSHAEHFKMQLHPNSKPASRRRFQVRSTVPPPSAPLDQIYSDYLMYLLRHTRTHIRRRIGYDPWHDLKDIAEIVLSHPNRWGKKQQKFLQAAAISAGLISRAGAVNRLHFVEEAEASACFALAVNPVLSSTLRKGVKFVVCDAGGSTVDISAYMVKSATPTSVGLEELDVPSCLDAGGIHVDKEFGMYLSEGVVTEPDLLDRPEDLREIISDGVADFRSSGKRRFASPRELCSVRIGGRRMNCPSLGVDRGVMHIPGPTAETFFSPFVTEVIDSLAERVQSHNIRCIILTGGFSESPYFKNEVERMFGGTNCSIVIANSPNSKAVAIGALYLVVRRDGSMAMSVERKSRPWSMWLTDLGTRTKLLFAGSVSRSRAQSPHSPHR